MKWSKSAGSNEKDPQKLTLRNGRSSPQYELILGPSADLWDYDGPKMPGVLKLLSGLPLATVKSMEIIGKISS